MSDAAIYVADNWPSIIDDESDDFLFITTGEWGGSHAWFLRDRRGDADGSFEPVAGPFATKSEAECTLRRRIAEEIMLIAARDEQ